MLIRESRIHGFTKESYKSRYWEMGELWYRILKAKDDYFGPEEEPGIEDYCHSADVMPMLLELSGLVTIRAVGGDIFSGDSSYILTFSKNPKKTYKQLDSLLDGFLNQNQ